MRNAPPKTAYFRATNPAKPRVLPMARGYVYATVHWLRNSIARRWTGFAATNQPVDAACGPQIRVPRISPASMFAKEAPFPCALGGRKFPSIAPTWGFRAFHLRDNIAAIAVDTEELVNGENIVV